MNFLEKLHTVLATSYLENIRRKLSPLFFSERKCGLMCLVLIIGLLSSCKDDNLVLNPQDPSIEGANNQYTLSFGLSLPSLGNASRSRANDVEEFEDYVDKDKLYIIFLLKDDTDKDKDKDKIYRIFEPKHRAISLIPVTFNNKLDEYQKNWYVRISIPDVENADEFVSKLKENDFRIAVVANADPQKPLKLNASYKDETLLKLGDDINLLHFQSENDPYSLDGNLYGEDKNPYFFLFNENPSESPGTLGMYTDWVKERYLDVQGIDNAENLASWLRSNWDPTSHSNELGDYVDLWQLYNFGGTALDNALMPDTYSDKWEKWEKVNGYQLRGFITSVIEDDQNIDKRIEGFKTEENVPLELIGFDETGVYSTAVCRDYNNGTKLYGIKLPQNTLNAGFSDENTYTKFNPHDGGCLSFSATGSGHLKITGACENEGSATIVAQVGKQDQKVKFTVTGTAPQESGEMAISITGDSNPIYIYVDSNSENSAEIYQIEYVQDTYLSETDREGIKPSLDQPIPMYGIASYEKLEKWQVGTSFDLNDYNGTSPDFDNPSSTNTYFHPIPLLRSVAKVIVRIPSSLNAHHVYLRGANRYARWEPSDVRTNTMEIWSDGNELDLVNQHNKNCEFFTLCEKELIFYDSTDKSEKDQLDSYKKKLAWYYGNWNEEGIMGNDYLDKGENNYPHIMNPLIYRSDFVQFLRSENEEIYDKYVLYVPEKFVDDPEDIFSTLGIEHSAPKVCHIEFRTGDDKINNLDDNDCYRIYFTKDGFGEGMNTPDMRDDDHSWEKMYEQNVANLKKHWPILRNHAYRFTVKDVSFQTVIVSLEVLPWKEVEDIKVTW